MVFFNSNSTRTFFRVAEENIEMNTSPVESPEDIHSEASDDILDRFIQTVYGENAR